MIARSDLKLVFTGLITQYPGAGRVFDPYWKEIVDAYQEEKRCYHNLDHLNYIYRKLEECTQKAENREAVLFALFYHDLIYDIPNNNNEARSAETGAMRMTGLGLGRSTIDLCVKHILATRDHRKSDNPDTDLFCDADIAILGESGPVYDDYCRKVRREYFEFSEEEFARGRSAEIQKLLEMEQIFKTQHFHDRYEKAARRNLATEIEKLSRLSAR